MAPLGSALALIRVGRGPGSIAVTAQTMTKGMGIAFRCRGLLDAYKEEAVRSLAALQNASLKGLLRRVVAKIFAIEVKGWCSEFEARNAAGRPAGAEAAG